MVRLLCSYDFTICSLQKDIWGQWGQNLASVLKAVCFDDKGLCPWVRSCLQCTHAWKGNRKLGCEVIFILRIHASFLKIGTWSVALKRT